MGPTQKTAARRLNKREEGVNILETGWGPTRISNVSQSIRDSRAEISGILIWYAALASLITT